MRDYGVLYIEFWNNPDIQGLSDQAKLLAIYLLANRHGTMLGCYPLLLNYIGADLAWPADKVAQAVNELIQIEFVIYDNQYEWIFINNFLKWNSVQNPNQAKKLVKLASKIPKASCLRPQLMSVLQTCNHMKPEILNRFITVTQPYRNQDQKQEQNQKQDQEKNTQTRAQEKTDSLQTVAVSVCDKAFVNQQSVTNPSTSEQNLHSHRQTAIQHIFEHWKITLNHPEAQLDADRITVIQKGLALNFSIDQLCQAITGCSRTPYYMGVNERHEIFDGLHVIFKNRHQIERFIRQAKCPPTNTILTSKQANNISSLKHWLNKKLGHLKTANGVEENYSPQEQRHD